MSFVTAVVDIVIFQRAEPVTPNIDDLSGEKTMSLNAKPTLVPTPCVFSAAVPAHVPTQSNIFPFDAVILRTAFEGASMIYASSLFAAMRIFDGVLNRETLLPPLTHPEFLPVPYEPAIVDTDVPSILRTCL